MVVNVLLCFVCRHNRRRTFRTYSLLLPPCSLFFCGAHVFFVAKANEVTDASEARVGAERGNDRKNSAQNSHFAKGVGRDLKIERCAMRFRVST